MGFEKPKPVSVTDAIKSGDSEYLRTAGRKGAEVVNAKKKRERERLEIAELQAEVEAEKRALEDADMRRSANEHIITPDGDDISES